MYSSITFGPNAGPKNNCRSHSSIDSRILWGKQYHHFAPSALLRLREIPPIPSSLPTTADQMAENPAAAATTVPPPSVSLGHAVIPIVNRLQDIFAQLGGVSTIELPQVAVVGSQSSGKSSVLEALVGRDFLPRGNDICTRRPLLLQLVNRPRKGEGGDGEGDEWGEFLHLPNKRFYDFSMIRREIQAETDREAGGNKGVSEKQIRLKIFSPNVLNIALIDLPGITKVPVGDQPTDIEARIRTMILNYIKHETCIILAVSPANADLANSDALQMARMADPDGSRTIGVITKLDIMDRGTDACNFLMGKVIPLRLGYVGVVNRSQQDINNNLSVKEALASEEKFFREKPVYQSLSHCCGVPRLAKKLNQILVQHIKTVLPGLKSRINAQMVAAAKEHAAYGDVPESKAGQGAKILNILANYCEVFSSMVEGKSGEVSPSQLSGGARIHYIFQSIFVKTLEDVDPCDYLTDEDIRLSIRNSTGPKSALFVPEVPFEIIVRKQIGRLLDPSLQCARFIYDELIKMSHRCLATELQRFPVLRKRMDEVIGNFLREGLEPAKMMLTHIIEMEMDYINTSHPNFIGGNKAVEIAQQEVKLARLSTSTARAKEGVENDKLPASDKSSKSRAFLGRLSANGIASDQGARPVADSDRPGTSGVTTGTLWSIPSFFGASENRPPARDSSVNESYGAPVQNSEHSLSMIQLREPPLILKPSETHTEQEDVEIAITKLLLKSYYDIVRKSIEDSVPKAIMHFLVNHTKRELHNVLIRKLYRENLFEEMLREPDEVANRRRQIQQTLRVLELAHRTLEEIPFEADTVEKEYSPDTDSTGPYLSSTNYSPSPNNPRSRRLAFSGEQPIYSKSVTNGF